LLAVALAAAASSGAVVPVQSADALEIPDWWPVPDRLRQIVRYMNSAEFDYCIWHPSRWNNCIQAWEAKWEADSMTKIQFPPAGNDDSKKSNAFYHAWWHVRMTHRMSGNPATALRFGELHEAGWEWTPESQMDLHNNAVGAYTGRDNDQPHSLWSITVKANRAILKDRNATPLWGPPGETWELWFIKK